jgi:hypothetical protein
LVATDKRLYFLSLKENVPFSKYKKGYRLVFYIPFDLPNPYRYYLTRCAELLEFKIDHKNLLIATINFDEYKYHSHFRSTLMPIKELTSFK